MLQLIFVGIIYQRNNADSINTHDVRINQYL